MNGLAPAHLKPEESITWTKKQHADWEIEEALRFAPGTHPLDCIREWMPFELYGWQRDVLAAGCQPHSRTIMSTANESGKTSVVIPAFGLGLMMAFPGCCVYSTSGSDRQVKEQLFEQQLVPQVERRGRKDKGWKIKTGGEMKLTTPNGSSWLGYVCQNDLTAEGFHGSWEIDDETGEKRYCPCVYIVDEGKSVGDGVHEAIRRIDPDFWITLSTPGKESGWFFEGIDPDSLRVNEFPETFSKTNPPFNPLDEGNEYSPNPVHDYRKEYENLDSTMIFTYRRMVDWEECPHLLTEKKKIERLKIKRKYGEKSAFVKSMLYGQFQRADDYSLIYTDDDLELMKEAMRQRNKPVGGDVRAASDTSGGGDAQPLMVRIGTKIILQERAGCPTGIEHAEELKSRLTDLGIDPWQFVIDGGGLGAEVANYLEKRLDYSGIRRAQANQGPRFKFEYRDKYTETHFLIKELLTAGVLNLSYNEALLKQMRCRRFIEMEAGNKIKTEPKKAHREREKSSPDELDTLVYLFYDFDWSLISVFREENEATTDESEPTALEVDAANSSRISGRVFGQMKNLRKMREQISADHRRVSKLRIGR